MQDNIIIRQAGMDEIERVMLFLKENWGEHHIMANSKELMCYEHAWNGEFTFMIAEEKIKKKYMACMDIFPTLKENHGIWEEESGRLFKTRIFYLALNYLSMSRSLQDAECLQTAVLTQERKGTESLLVM